MNQDGTSLATHHLLAHSLLSKFDINELIEKVAQLWQDEHRNITVVLNLDPEAPKLSADPQQIESVLLALFAHAQNAVVAARSPYGTIAVHTVSKAGRVQFFITDESAGERCSGTLGPIFRRKPEDDNNLTICAEIVQDEGGELYAWRPYNSAGTTVVMDLPVPV